MVGRNVNGGWVRVPSRREKSFLFRDSSAHRGIEEETMIDREKKVCRFYADIDPGRSEEDINGRRGRMDFPFDPSCV